MNHLESVFSGKNSFWRYPLMIIIVILAANSIGSAPLLVSMLLRSFSDPGVFTQFAQSPNDYTILGYDANTFLVIMLFPFIAGLGAIIVFQKPLHARSFKSVINGTLKIRWNRFVISALIWTGLSVAYLVGYLRIDPQNFSLNNTTASVFILAAISLLLIPFQAAFEEVIFRGYLMQGFALLVRKRWFPLVMTSLLFGLMHAFNPEVKTYGFITMMPQYVLFGLIFGVVTVMDDGIEAAMGAHAANNAFLCIMVTNKSSALQTAAVYEQNIIHPWIELGATFIVGIIFVILLKRIFGWKGFSLLFSEIKRPAPSEPVN